MRTSVNVLGDSYGCGIIASMAADQLKKLDEDAEKEHSIANNTKNKFNDNTIRSGQSSIHEDLGNNTTIPANFNRRYSHKNHSFGESAIPESITSMPQISVYQASPNFNQDNSV